MVIGLLPTVALAAGTLPSVQNGTITLTEAVTLADTYEIGKDVTTLDLKGFTITGPSNKEAIYVKSGTSLTINAEAKGGIVSETTYAIRNDGTLIINGGTFTGKFDGTYAIRNDAGKLTINGGTFSMDVSEFIDANHQCVKNSDGLYEVTAITASGLTVAKAADTEDFGGKKNTDFSEDFTVEQTGKNITVSGSFKYVDMTDTQKYPGHHYLPIKITVEDAAKALKVAGVDVTVGEDLSVLHLVDLDKATENSATQFTITYGTDTYTVNITDIILAEKGTTVETVDNNVVATNTENDSVKIPTVNINVAVTVKVAPVEKAGIAQKITDVVNASESVKSFLSKAAKALEITVKAGEKEMFTDGTSVSIEVTIGSLASGKSYQILAARGGNAGDANKGKVTNYGWTTLAEGKTSITFKTNHLTTFFVMERPAETDPTFAAFKAALDEIPADTSVNPDLNQDTPSTDPGTDPGNTGKPSSGGSSGGGGGSRVSVTSTSHGTVTASPSSAYKGDKVTLNVKPDSGYELVDLIVRDSDGKKIDVQKVSDTRYTFIMPSGKVTIEPVFEKVGQGTPSSTITGYFYDVPSNAYYYDAVQWAIEKGITNGTSATTFSPNATCTRAQMVTFLWRAAGSPAPRTSGQSFTDVASGSYYYDAVLWAIEKGITNGTTSTTFSPNDTVTRGQMVTFLYRSVGSPAASSQSSFSDVASNAYYSNAINWAAEQGFVNGTTATTFAPATGCTRAHIVTFLYRANT